MPDAHQVRVLIVEDHPLTRFGLRAVLEKSDNGIKIVGEASDGHEAIDKARQLQPDVVLMDIGLPLKDGATATRELKDLMPEIRVLILTNRDDNEEIFNALAAGANGYCLKTISGEQLARAIRAVFDGAGWLDPGIASRVFQASLSNVATTSAGSGRRQNGTFSLSQREFEVLALLVDGLSNEEMAQRLIVSQETIKTHMRHIMEKLMVTDRTQAAVKAIREGLISSINGSPISKTTP